MTSGTGSLRIGRGSSIIGSETFGTLDGAAVSGTIDLASNHSKVRLVNGASFSGSARFSAEGATNYTAFDLHQDGVIDHALFLDTTPNLDAKAAFVVIGSHSVTLGPDVEMRNLTSINGDCFDTNTDASGLLTWTRALEGAVAQFTTNVVTGPWVAVTNAPVLVGDLYQLLIDFSAPQQFYRIGPPLGVSGLPAVKTR